MKGGVNDLIKIMAFKRPCAFSGKDQDICQEGFKPLYLLDYYLCIPLFRMPLKFLQKPSRKTAERSQRIPYFMRHVCGHLSQGSQFFGLQKPIVGLF